jgi:hypothetical protein
VSLAFRSKLTSGMNEEKLRKILEGVLVPRQGERRGGPGK